MKRRRLALALGGVLLLVLALPALLVALLGGVLGTPSGTAWVLAHMPGVEVVEPQGALLGQFSARRVTLRLGADRVVIDAPRWPALALAVGAGPGNWLALTLPELSADRVAYEPAPQPAGTAPPRLPADLRLPLQLSIGRLRIGEVALPGLTTQTLRHLDAQVQLGAERGRTHRVDALSLQLGALQLRGLAQVGSDAPLPITLKLDATQASGTHPPVLPEAARALREDWRAELQASGPLARFDASASVHAQGQSLAASAVVAPLAAWPLPQLELRTDGLDVSALLSGAPVTSLRGQVRIVPAATGAGRVDVQAQFDNARPGRWDQQRLPLRSLTLTLQADAQTLRRFDLTALDAVLAGDAADAGRLQASGHWERGAFQLDARLAGVQPRAIDGRAPGLTASGPLHLAGQAGGDSPWRIEARADLRGAWQAVKGSPGGALRLTFDAAGDAQRLALREFTAVAGAARASASGQAERGSGTGAAWQLSGQAALKNFDPVPWLPGAPDAAWRSARSQLNASADLRLMLPAALIASGDWAAHLAELRGDARLTLLPSSAAGVPVSGEASLSGSGADAPTQVHAALQLAGNPLRLDGRLAAQGKGAQDHWELGADAAALDTWTPLLRLAGLPQALAGSLELRAQADGRWPLLRAQGTLAAKGLRSGDMQLAQAQARWQLGSTLDAPLALDANLAALRIGVQQLDSARIQLAGTGRAHTLELNAVANARPPAWVDLLQGTAAGSDTRARSVLGLSARGGVSPTTASAWAWTGLVQRLDLRPSAAGAAPWVTLQDVALSLQPASAGQPAQVRAGAGRATLLGAALRWDHLHFDAASAASAAVLDVQAELEALAPAPLLARLQPDFGWGGDLALAGRIRLRSAPTVAAEVVIERVRGDLTVTDEFGTQPLGLTDLRLAVKANDGRWAFTQALAGSTLGVTAGAVTLSTSPQALWPAPDTPIQGVLDVRVANVATWGAWVPAGWRLGGELRTQAAIGGRFGAPEYTGAVTGSGLWVRNVLEGVNVNDGQIDIRLQGASATIVRFDARGGDGRVRLEGGASLIDTPTAQLKLVADKFLLLGRVDRRVVTSGQAELRLDAKTLALAGRFGVDEGLIDFTRSDAPALADDVKVIGRAGAEPKPLAPADPNARKVALDLQVGLGERLRLRGRGLDTGLRGDLQLSSPNNRLAVDGSVRTAGGTYAAYGQKLVIDRGVIRFSGGIDNPRLDIEATRPNLDVRVGATIQGTALNPRVRLFSDPDMSDSDKLSWLVLGHAPDNLGRNDTALLQSAAMALFAGEGPGLAGQLTQAFGLDELSLRQGGEGDVRETVVALGKQLSRRWYVGYERGLNATTGTWQLIYRIAQRFTLRAQSGEDNSVDLIWTLRWQ